MASRLADMAWLSHEAHNFHDIFQGAFFVLVTCFLLWGIIVELIKVPMGGEVAVTTLVGRVFIAVLLLIHLTIL